jgi:ketosteroid isomerase-like protein
MASRTPAEITIGFNECINRRDLAGLAGLMTEDHTFVDSDGAVVAGKPACVDAWRGFFEMFPDYRNAFDSITASGNTVTVSGRSECPEAALVGPAQWTAVVRDDHVARWQVLLP